MSYLFGKQAQHQLPEQWDLTRCLLMPFSHCWKMLLTKRNLALTEYGTVMKPEYRLCKSLCPKSFQQKGKNRLDPWLLMKEDSLWQHWSAAQPVEDTFHPCWSFLGNEWRMSWWMVLLLVRRQCVTLADESRQTYSCSGLKNLWSSRGQANLLKSSFWMATRHTQRALHWLILREKMEWLCFVYHHTAHTNSSHLMWRLWSHWPSSMTILCENGCENILDEWWHNSRLRGSLARRIWMLQAWQTL